MYEYLLNATESFIRYGMSPTALVVALIAFFKTKRFKRFVGRRAPWLFRDDSDVLNYQSRQIRIERDVRAIKEHLGVRECAENSDLSISTGKNSLISSCKEKSFVRTVGVFIQKALIIILRGNRGMKEYLKKLGRTKFQALLASLVVNIASAILFLNGTLDIDGKVNEWMPIINMTIGTISTWVYIIVEGGIDKANVTKEVSNVTYTSREDSEGA